MGSGISLVYVPIIPLMNSILEIKVVDNNEIN